jgi:hemerythrin-like domain-containing protein
MAIKYAIYGLPDFSGYVHHAKTEKIYPRNIGTKYKNDHKIYQMGLEYSEWL